jgi:hypothetical protein
VLSFPQTSADLFTGYVNLTINIMIFNNKTVNEACGIGKLKNFYFMLINENI